MAVRPSPIDKKDDLLRALTHHVRVLTLDQIARTWWSRTVRPKNNAKKCLRKLEQQGLVQCLTIMARPEIELPEPVFTWTPGDPDPNFGPIAYRLKNRWKEPFVPTQAVIATREAMRNYGGYIGGRAPRDSEATHDIHLGQVYLHLRGQQPELLQGWVSEAQQYAEGGGKNARLPDVIIRDAGSAQLILEFAGAYSKQKLEAFHGEASHIQYQLW
jgi:hypothetical protein